MPAISKEQLDILVNHALTERDKVILNMLWYSGMRLSEAANVEAKDFNWQEGTLIILGKGNRYRKALAGNGIVTEAINKKATGVADSTKFVIGRVLNTNDPQQMGRIQAFCTGLGDNENQPMNEIPWCMYVSPLGGVSVLGKRGTEEDEVDGPVSYGMWNIPKIGAYVLVGTIEGNKE